MNRFIVWPIKRQNTVKMFRLQHEAFKRPNGLKPKDLHFTARGKTEAGTYAALKRFHVFPLKTDWFLVSDQFSVDSLIITALASDHRWSRSAAAGPGL